jgi:hypothetical protein
MASKFSPNKLQLIEILEKIKKLTEADFFAQAGKPGPPTSWQPGELSGLE